ncbi:MAG: PIN domain-containing protein [Solirubrobacteraceae bacterium MAG38_C4-C5]|nr:PIN domain-containing protein [Candidatus Siliceabacter maunaloa]
MAESGHILAAAYAAVLDASVLYPLPLRDTLLRIAERELYDPYWSDRILDEVVRNLVADGRANHDQARGLINAMTAAFDAAAVPVTAIARFEDAMTNHPNDRHVLAAAVASGAQAIVTLNLRDFPVEACEPFAVAPVHPDVFVLDLYGRDGEEVYNAVEGQAAALARPPMSLEELLDRLAVTMPSFVQALRTHR